MSEAEPGASTEPVPSRGLIRWALPLGLTWAQALMSAWVYGRIPSPEGLDPLRLALVLAGGPAASLACLLLIRAAERSALRTGQGHSGPDEDLVVAWVMCFLFGVHAVVLALAAGILRAVEQVLPIAALLLLAGLGPLLSRLPEGSLMGLRTRRTLGSASAWRRAHASLAWIFPGAGALSLCAYAAPGGFAVLVALAPAVLALILSITYAGLLVDPGHEQDPQEKRRKDDTTDAQP